MYYVEQQKKKNSKTKKELMEMTVLYIKQSTVLWKTILDNRKQLVYNIRGVEIVESIP